MPESLSNSIGPAGSSDLSRKLGRVSWITILLISIFLLALPSNFGSGLVDPSLAILLLTSVLCGVWVTLTLSASLLVLTNIRLFQRSSGLLAVGCLYLMLTGGWGVLSQSGSPEISALGQARVFIGSWLLVLPVVVGLALGVYLWYRDNAVRLMALTFMLLVWALVLFVRRHGADQLLLNILSPDSAANLGWFQSLLCPVTWLLLLGPFSFMVHSIRLLYREWMSLS